MAAGKKGLRGSKGVGDESAVALLVPSRRELGRSLLGLHQADYPLRGMSDHAVSESHYLDDPDGNGLEIYADRPGRCGRFAMAWFK